ncbi:AraC family transcriptional regulator, partial [Rhizobium ruizarguesonis]
MQRQMIAESPIDFDIARKLEAFDPMAMMLRALVAKIMSNSASDAASANLRHLMLNETRQAFVSNGDAMSALNDSASRRLE